MATRKEVPEEVCEINNEKITNKEARICIDKLFNYCEQNNFTVEDFCELRKFKDKIENNINSALTQKKIVDVFSKVSLNKD